MAGVTETEEHITEQKKLLNYVMHIKYQQQNHTHHIVSQCIYIWTMIGSLDLTIQSFLAHVRSLITTDVCSPFPIILS